MHKLPNEEEVANFNEILNGDKELTGDEKRRLKKWYLSNYEEVSLHNFFKDEKEAYEYYSELSTLCLNRSMSFRHTIATLLAIDTELALKRSDIEGEDQVIFLHNYGRELAEKIIKKLGEIEDGGAIKTAMIKNGVGLMINEVINNTFDEAEKMINHYMQDLKAPFSEINTTVSVDNMKPMGSDINSSFTKSSSFTKLIYNNTAHGLTPLIQEDDTLFYTKHDIPIHLPLLRGLVSGHIKSTIIKSINVKSMITNLNNSISGMFITNQDGDLDKKIDELKKLISFIDWASKHKKHIEYFDIAKYMNLSKDETKLFAMKFTGKNKGSFPKNIEKLMYSESHDLTIDKFIDITDDCDGLILFGDSKKP